jgi:hypothetical protein
LSQICQILTKTTGAVPRSFRPSAFSARQLRRQGDALADEQIASALALQQGRITWAAPNRSRGPASRLNPPNPDVAPGQSFAHHGSLMRAGKRRFTKSGRPASARRRIWRRGFRIKAAFG